MPKTGRHKKRDEGPAWGVKLEMWAMTAVVGMIEYNGVVNSANVTGVGDPIGNALWDSW